MKIKLIKPTIINGKHEKNGWENEVSFAEGNYLISMGKAERVGEEELTAVSLKIDVENMEVFEEMKEALKIAEETVSFRENEYKLLVESLRECTNIQCVKEILDAGKENDDEA